MGAPLFRLGSTSYVYPGDLVYNAERLAGVVDDVELVLYCTADGQTNYPNSAHIERLAELSQQHGLTYTVHLPHDLEPLNGQLSPALDAAREVIALTEPLSPYAYVFHAAGTGLGTTAWQEGIFAAIDQVVAWVRSPSQLALENLESYPPEALEPVFDRFPVSRTLDIGHLWRMGRDPLPVMDSWLPKTRVVHLHGLEARDHMTLAVMQPAVLDPIIERLVGWSGVLTLEVFEDDFFSSKVALEAALARLDIRDGHL